MSAQTRREKMTALLADRDHYRILARELQTENAALIDELADCRERLAACVYVADQLQAEADRLAERKGGEG